jgi:hypothetical protein
VNGEKPCNEVIPPLLHTLPGKLLFVDERATASAVWREAGALIQRHPVAILLPAAFLGMLMEVPYLLPDSQYVLQDILAFLTQAFAFYLYVAYAEEVTLETQRGEHIPLREVLGRLLLATPAVPFVVAASVVAIGLPSAAASLLVIPGLWLLTRWSLFAPAIVRERLGPFSALRRSSEVVQGHFELVFLTAAFAVILEEAVLGAGAYVGLIVSGSETWGEWVGGSVAAVLILPLASFATALAYSLLSEQA